MPHHIPELSTSCLTLIDESGIERGAFAVKEGLALFELNDAKGNTRLTIVVAADGGVLISTVEQNAEGEFLDSFRLVASNGEAEATFTDLIFRDNTVISARGFFGPCGCAKAVNG